MTDLDSRDPLMWLSRILWPDQSTTIVAEGASSPRWWASPSVDQPNILVPADAPAAALTAVRRYHDGFSLRRRVRSLMAEGLMATRPLAELSLRTKRVGVGGSPNMVDSGVLTGLADLLGIEDLHVAISLSTPKSNQKPVLQLLDGTGRCHGWAKVAWNDRTEALVGAEARWLRRVPRPPLSIPTLLHDVRLAGRRVVVTSGVEPSRLPRRPIDRLPSADVFRAVASLGTVDTVGIKESRWWHTVESVLEWATPRELLAVQAAADSCSRLQFQVGAWHGDLTPWNLMTTRSSVQLIDWEFGADGAPLGFDLCHFHTQVGAELRGHDAAGALDRSARLAPHGLARLGVAPENRLPVWRLYLVELLRRSVALRADGYPLDGVTHGSAALDRLERSLGIGPGEPGPRANGEPEPPTPAVADADGYTIRDRATPTETMQ